METRYLGFKQKNKPRRRASSKLFLCSRWRCCKCMILKCFIRGCKPRIQESQQGHFHFFFCSYEPLVAVGKIAVSIWHAVGSAENKKNHLKIKAPSSESQAQRLPINQTLKLHWPGSLAGPSVSSQVATLSDQRQRFTYTCVSPCASHAFHCRSPFPISPTDPITNCFLTGRELPCSAEEAGASLLLCVIWLLDILPQTRGVCLCVSACMCVHGIPACTISVCRLINWAWFSHPFFLCCSEELDSLSLHWPTGCELAFRKQQRHNSKEAGSSKVFPNH